MKQFFEQYRLLIAITLAGLVLRLWQLGWGLPELFEEATPMSIALRMWTSPHLDLNPHFFNYPALAFYLHLIVQLIVYGVGSLFGAFPNPAAFSSSLATLVITARAFTALVDTATIVVVYLICMNLMEKRTALIAAGLTALNPLLISQAHIVEVDPFLTFFGSLAVLFSSYIFTRGEKKWYLLAGMGIGLAAASKYTGFFLLPVPIVAHMLRSRSLRASFRSLAAAMNLRMIGAALLFFIIANPFILSDSATFQKDFAFEQYHASSGHLGIDDSKSTLFYYLLNVLGTGFGWVLYIVTLAAAVWMVIKRDKRFLLLLSGPVVYTIIISSWQMRAERYILPIVPLLCIICAVGLTFGFDEVRKRLAGESFAQVWENEIQRQLIYLVLAMVLLFQPVMTIAGYLRSLSLPDTRIAAKQWIRTHLRQGGAIATGPYGIEFPDTVYNMLFIPFQGFQVESALPFYDTRWYEDLDLVITSDYDYARYAQEPERYRGFLNYYDSLKARWIVVKDFAPDDQQLTGPHILLYAFPAGQHRMVFPGDLFTKLDGNPETTKVSIFLNNLSAIELGRGQYAKCEQILDMIVANEGGNIDARNTLANIQYILGKYPSALRHLQLSLQFNPQQPRAYALAGRVLLRLKRTTEAEGALAKAISMDPHFETPYVDLIEIYTGAHENDKLASILTLYQKVLPPDSAQLRKDIGSRLRKLGRKG